VKRTFLIAALLGAVLTPAAEAAPWIHAHRGGSLVEGKPTYGENTMPAFRASAAKGFVLELDVKLTADGVPVVFHDAGLERATDCEGLVVDKTAAELRDCEVDILGTTEKFEQLGPDDERRAEIPRFAQVLKLIRRTGVHANIEIKNQPTDPDFDAGAGFARTVAEAIARSGVPPSNLILQSFWPPNLEAAKPIVPDVDLSLLTLSALNEGAPAFAKASGYAWVSPQWPVGSAFITEAHALGLQVVPYTIDDGAAMGAATEAGVDAIITNDPTRARRVVARTAPARPKIPPAPTKAECGQTSARTHLPAVVSRAPRPGAPRVFAIQYHQELRHVETYETFRTKIECLLLQYVVPRLARNRPNVAALNEDVGLMTIATGSRGALARGVLGDPESAPSCESEGVPCAALAGQALILASYPGPAAAYEARFPVADPLELSLLVPVDTYARGWMQVFSDMARRYGVYMIGSNTQAPFRESTDPSEISLFADPDLPQRPESVYVATEGTTYNEAFIWAPDDVRREGPTPLRNVVAQNKKVPLTPFEIQLEISEGPATGPDAIENLKPYRIPGTKAKLGIATSLPAFTFGHELGEPLPIEGPCADTSVTYMRCLDHLGANVVIQDEANPGRWPARGGNGYWQPLEWMRSVHRQVVDPTVSFDYNVTPFMVGNLADIGFDGQSSITQRAGTAGPGCNFIGNRHFMPEPPESDPPQAEVYAGPKRRFLAIAPWVKHGRTRDSMREIAAQLAAGSGHPRENDYVETALIADLPFPVIPGRRGCLRPPLP
jgi:glycerophosphoryl diester phosphodiesterase